VNHPARSLGHTDLRDQRLHAREDAVSEKI
jgi:hypothetical protein